MIGDWNATRAVHRNATASSAVLSLRLHEARVTIVKDARSNENLFRHDDRIN